MNMVYTNIFTSAKIEETAQVKLLLRQIKLVDDKNQGLGIKIGDWNLGIENQGLGLGYWIMIGYLDQGKRLGIEYTNKLLIKWSS